MSGTNPRQFNQRIGWSLFAIYLVLYSVFIVLCGFLPQVMEWRPLGGLNLAILYGFGLIIAAFVLATIYGFACRAEPAQEADADEGQN